MNYTIIIPLFNEELNAIKLHDELLKALDNNYFKNKKFEIIASPVYYILIAIAAIWFSYVLIIGLDPHF